MTININCETESEYSNSLISALSACSTELDRINQKYKDLSTTLKEEVEAHKNNKESLDKEKEAHTNARKMLEQEVEAHKNTKESLDKEKEAHTNTKKMLEQEVEAHKSTKESLDKEKEAHTNARKMLEQEVEAHKNTKESLDKEKEAHTNTKKMLEQEVEAHKSTNKEIKEYQERLFKEIIIEFNKIQHCLEEDLEKIDNEELKQYVISIIRQSKGGWSECMSMDNLLYNCKVGSGAICRIVNLIWWNKQENLQYLMSLFTNIDVMEQEMNIICKLISITGHTIEFPSGQLSKDIPNFTPYDDERSNFIDIFDSEEYSNDTLCEIRLLSVDGDAGKIYTYYK